MEAKLSTGEGGGECSVKYAAQNTLCGSNRAVEYFSSTECTILAICTDYWHPFCAAVASTATLRVDYY